MLKRLWEVTGGSKLCRLLLLILAVGCASSSELSRGEDRNVDSKDKTKTTQDRAQKKRNTPDVQLLISAKRTKFGPGEPIVVEVSTKNTGKVPFYAVVKGLSEDMQFTIHDHSDKEVPLTRKGKTSVPQRDIPRLLGGPTYRFQVDPGEFLEPKHAKRAPHVHESRSLNVNVYYDMTQDGNYKIKAVRQVRIGAMNAKLIDVESNTIEISIDPQYANPCCLEKPKEVEPKPRALLPNN